MFTTDHWFQLHLVIFVVLFLLLVVSVPIYAGNGNLSEDAAIVGTAAIVLSVFCAGGIAVGRRFRSAWAAVPLFFVTGGMHVIVTIIMIKEWTEDDCDAHIFALCTDGVANFLDVILIDLVVQVIFLIEYRMLWEWKNVLLVRLPKRFGIHNAEDNEGGEVEVDVVGEF